MKEKIIVIGTGEDAERFLFHYRNDYEVMIFADDNPRRHSFRGKSVVVLESILAYLTREYKIIIATSIEEYIDVSRRLNKIKLIEFEDYIYYKAINKKMAIFSGNCQCQQLKTFLEELKEFADQYWCYPYQAIQNADPWYMPATVLEHCSLLIYQAIKTETNGLLHSSKYLEESVRRGGGIALRLPNLFKCGNGWYPQSMYRDPVAMRPSEYLFVVNSDNQDKIIKDLAAKGIGAKKIANMIREADIWSKEEIVSNFNTYLQKIKSEDESCDIKIYNYIVKSYKNELIFTDSGHVSNGTYIEYIRQIMKHLNIEIKTDLKLFMQCHQIKQNMPIYGCVATALELKYIDTEQIIKEGTFTLSEDGLTIEEYVEQYMFMCVNACSI